MARTDSEAAPHKGISFFLLDMAAGGRRAQTACAR